MKLLAVVSAKGGVGKTTMAANLVAALAQSRNAVCVDLDPQNALRLHLGIPSHEIDGIGRCTLEKRSWREALFQGSMNTGVLPYGALNETDRDAFEVYLAEHPQWLTQGLAHLGLGDDDLVVIDTPPGPSLYLQQALRAAHFVLVVIQADAASYATLPAMEGLLKRYCNDRLDFTGAAYLINNVQSDKALSKDVVEVVRAQLGEKVVPLVIHQDEAVREALAFDKLVLDYDPHCEATHDILGAARWITSRMLPVREKSRGLKSVRRS